VKSEFVDFSIGAVKIAPPAVVAVASKTGQIDPQSLLIWLSIVYTVGLLAQLVTNNGRRWIRAIIGAFRWIAKRSRRGKQG